MTRSTRTIPENAKEDTSSQRTYEQILEHKIIAGEQELRRPTLGLLLSSLSAGLDIGFSVLLMAVALTLLPGGYGDPVTELVLANLYAVGFILVLLGRSELFTEHTAIALLPVLDGAAPLWRLGRAWGLIFTGNMIGAVAFASFAWIFAPVLGIAELHAFEEIGHKLVKHDWWVMLLSAILAGWLMGEMAWISGGARDTISKVFFVWLIAAIIGGLHLHHVVVGAVEVVAAALAGPRVGLGDVLLFLLIAAVGNAIGGVVFVALIKYGHASRGGDEDSDK